MSLLSKSYSSGCYFKEGQIITFEVHNRKTSITKSRFCSLLGLAQNDDDEPVQHEDTATTSHPKLSQPISMNPKVTFEILVSVPITNEFFEVVFVPSPTTTVSTPITIAQCPPASLGILQSPPPIFTDFTTTPTTTVEPPVIVNASNAGEGDLGFSYNPFNIRTKSDDEAPVTRGKLNAINEKLDFFLKDSKASSSDDFTRRQ
ncbi:unnamed protein product [Lactuca saligna]|uniref:Uncharacterized protein n=1 Tax=Lactuca saligna TaxID=75948 RepID=A0AA36EE15_LACSI|nr:unnamed protein product [Lactuca saligna]